MDREVNLEIRVGLLFKGHWLIILLLIWGCAGTPQKKVYFSRPEVLKSSNDTFDVNIKPIKLKTPYYVGFQLTVLNKTSSALSIDWDKTRYILNGQDQGKFIYKGIDPESVSKGIPKEAIPGGALLSKPIYPMKKLGVMQKKDTSNSGQNNFFPGILPNGSNAALLAIVQGERQWRQALKFEFDTKETP